MSQVYQTAQDRGEQETAKKSQRTRKSTQTSRRLPAALRPKGTHTHELQTLTGKWMQPIPLQHEKLSQVASQVKENRLQRPWGYGHSEGAIFLIYLFG